jgi:Domain of unknown function (DUF397)
MPVPDLSRAAWRKSSYSNGSGGSCVEVADIRPQGTRDGPDGTLAAVTADSIRTTMYLVAVRDSKDRGGPVLVFAADEWRAFAAGIRAGEFELS